MFREPSQVFALLETIHKVFDKTAKCHKVLIVEMIGDCYIAMTALCLYCFLLYRALKPILQVLGAAGS
jgi:hypothetical protein